MMHRSPKGIWGWVFILSLAGFGILVSASAAAAPTPPPSGTSEKADRVWIPLPVPSVEEVLTEAHRAPEAVEVAIAQWAERTAAPMLKALQELQAEGRIEGFRLRPDLFAIEVWGASSQTLRSLPLPPGVPLVSSSDVPSCVTAGAKAVRDQFQALSIAPTQSTLQSAGVSIQATNPSIDVYAPPWSSYTYVTGRTDPRIPVILRVYRGGRKIVEQTTTSDSNGNYSFYPPYLGSTCGGTSGYAWTLRPKDVVEVSADGRTAQTVVAPLKAWANPQTNQVAGQTEPGRSVEAVLQLLNPDLCSITPITHTGGTDGAGNFTISFPEDFDGQAKGWVYARDGNGNSTFVDVSAFHLEALLGGDYFYGILPPETPFTAALWRGGTVISSTTRTTSGSGSFFVSWYPDRMQPGDVISVTGPGVTLQMTVTSLQLSFDRVANQISGVTAPNHRIRGWFYKATSYPVANTCAYEFVCQGTTSDANGHFSMSTPLDLERGDEVNIRIIDRDGNIQYLWRYVPILIIEHPQRSGYSTGLSGYWGDPSATVVTITLKAPDNSVKEQYTVSPSGWGGGFWAYFYSATPGDRVEVTDGRTTEQTTIYTLTARLDGGTGQLRGQASAARVVAYLRDYRRDSLYWGSEWASYSNFCAEGNIAGGSFTLSFPNAQAGGMDQADFWVFDSDGHAATFGLIWDSTPWPGIYLYRPLSAFTVWASWEGRVWGVVESRPIAGSIPVTITVQRGASVLTTTIASASPMFDRNLGISLQVGDRLQIQTGDGDAADLTVPSLTVGRDSTNQRITGSGPANDWVQAFVVRWTSSPQDIRGRTVRTGTDGAYAADFAGGFWVDCSPIRMDHTCVRGRVDYINAQGHTVSRSEPPPPPVSADDYEPDDEWGQARFYTGIQAHTFHTITDTDWISFTVPASDVGVPYLIRIFDTGWGVYSDIELYRNPNESPVNSWWFYGNRDLRWTPEASGTYYLKIRAGYSGAHCDARYRLLILPARGRIFLPLIMRNY